MSDNDKGVIAQAVDIDFDPYLCRLQDICQLREPRLFWMFHMIMRHVVETDVLHKVRESHLRLLTSGRIGSMPICRHLHRWDMVSLSCSKSYTTCHPVQNCS